MKGILFDFFGTLVTYSTSRVEQGYHTTHTLLFEHGVNLSYEAFLAEWVHSHEFWDHHTAATGQEYAMNDVAVRFLSRVAPHQRRSSAAPRKTPFSSAIRMKPIISELHKQVSGRYTSPRTERIRHHKAKRSPPC